MRLAHKMTYVVVGLTLTAACGRVGFTSLYDDAEGTAVPDVDGGDVDSSTVASDAGDGAPAADADIVAVNFIVDDFAEADAIESLNTPLGDDDMSLTSDELEIVFERSDKLWLAKRASTASPFNAPETIAGTSSSNCEGGAALSGDGLTLYFHRTATSACDSVAHIYVSTRVDRDTPFETALRVPELDLATGERSPHVTNDGLRLVFFTSPGPNLYEASRSSVDEPFSAPRPLTELDTATREDSPWLSDDGRTIVFARVPAGQEKYELYVATRPNSASAFDIAQPLTTVNGLLDESDPWISPDGQRIYFASTRNAEFSDLFVAWRR